MTVHEDEQDKGDVTRRKKLVQVKERLQGLAMLLEDVVGEGFREVKRKLVEEEGSLEGLFGQ